MLFAQRGRHDRGPRPQRYPPGVAREAAEISPFCGAGACEEIGAILASLEQDGAEGVEREGAQAARQQDAIPDAAQVAAIDGQLSGVSVLLLDLGVPYERIERCRTVIDNRCLTADQKLFELVKIDNSFINAKPASATLGKLSDCSANNSRMGAFWRQAQQRRRKVGGLLAHQQKSDSRHLIH